jgi:hypothetical protein
MQQHQCLEARNPAFSLPKPAWSGAMHSASYKEVVADVQVHEFGIF